MDYKEKFIVKMVLQEDSNEFLYSQKHVKHGDGDMIKKFFTHVKNEMKEKLHEDVEASALEATWYKMRQKFVKMNLKKSRYEEMTDAAQSFYRVLIFLEDHISHKNHPVFKTPNQKKIVQEVYDELMGNTEDPAIDHNSDTEQLQILEGYEEVVSKNLHKRINTDANVKVGLSQKNPNLKLPLISNAKVSRNETSRTNANFEAASPSTNSYQKLPSIWNAQVPRDEMQLASSRAKADLCHMNFQNQVKREIVEILYNAILEYSDETVKEMRFNIIKSAIDTFSSKDDK